MKNFVCKAGMACIGLCVFLTISNASFCQKFKYLTAEENMKNWNHSLSSNGDGGFLDVSYDDKKRNYTATICDAELKNILFKELGFLDNKTYQFTFFSSGTLYMFAMDKNESLMKYEVNPKTFALVGSPENIFSVDDDVVEYRSVYSKDSAFFSILCRHHKKKGTDDHFSGIVFNQAFSIVNRYEFSSLVSSDDVTAINFMLSETGTTAVICTGVKQKKKSDNEIKYSTTIISVNEKPVTKLVSGFPSASNQNLKPPGITPIANITPHT